MITFLNTLFPAYSTKNFLYFIRMQNNEGDHYKDSDIFMHICVIQ